MFISFFFSYFNGNFHITQFWYGEMKNRTHFLKGFYFHLHLCLDYESWLWLWQNESKKIFLRFSWKFLYMVSFRINARGVYLKIYLFRRRLFELGVYLQIRTIVDMSFFFDTRQAIEGATNLYYNLCFILDHIHFFIGILFIRGRNE